MFFYRASLINYFRKSRFFLLSSRLKHMPFFFKKFALPNYTYNTKHKYFKKNIFNFNRRALACKDSRSFRSINFFKLSKNFLIVSGKKSGLIKLSCSVNFAINGDYIKNNNRLVSINYRSIVSLITLLPIMKVIMLLIID